MGWVGVASWGLGLRFRMVFFVCADVCCCVYFVFVVWLVVCLLVFFVTCLYVWLFACLRARLCVALLISFDCILFVCLVFIFLFFCLRCWGLGFRFRHL